MDRYLRAAYYPYKIWDQSYGNDLDSTDIWYKIEEVVQIVLGSSWIGKERKEDILRKLYGVQAAISLEVWTTPEIGSKNEDNH
ncbi:MAG: hypothetical protein PHP59_00440 [Methanofollis sp.]|uniref:hypothetical protein n=1 Tax=Methanofollis sp. TaxID=2052835 RepID=UPI00262F0178|nr:hypothetical protein [Methanofollis sp.]MDD4253830.1 hypothetical protein [Methanofollis sp.]